MSLPMVGLSFWDHSMDNAVDLTLIKCQIVGWLYKEDELSYYIATWICDGKVMDRNTEAFQILKSTVIEKFQLSADPVKRFRFKRRKA